MHNTFSSFVAAAFALVAGSLTINAQVPTGGFQAGDFYEQTASGGNNGPVPFGGIIHIDAVTGSTDIVKLYGSGSSGYSNISYDAYRDRLAFSYSNAAAPTPSGLTLMTAAGSETLINMGYLPSKVAPGPNGNIYVIHGLGGGPTPYVFDYIDAANVPHTLLNDSTSLQFGISIVPRDFMYDASTNSIFVTTFGASPSCAPSQSTTIIYKFPLSSNGTSVTGAVFSTEVCASGFDFLVPIGLSRGANGMLNLTMRGGGGGSTMIHTKIIAIDPATLAQSNIVTYINSQITIPRAPTTATFSHFYNKTASIDTFQDELILLSGSGINTLVPNTASPSVSSAGGFAEIVTITEVDYGGLGLFAYGAGTPGCDGPQVLYGLTAPKGGTTSFRLLCTNAPAFSLGLVLIGNAPDVIGTDVLGINVPLYIDIFASTEFLTADIYSDGSGLSATAPLNIPAALTGQDFYAQALWYWTTCGLPPLNLSGSNGLKLTIQ